MNQRMIKYINKVKDDFKNHSFEENVRLYINANIRVYRNDHLKMYKK